MTIMGSSASNKCGSLDPAQVRAYSYLITRLVIKVAFGRIKLFFITKKRSKQETIVNAAT